MASLFKARHLRRLLLGIALACVMAGCGGSGPAATPTTPANGGPETTSTSATQPPDSALDGLLPTAEEIGTEGRVTTRNGHAQALHGLLGRKGSPYDFSLRAFDVRRSEFSDRVPGAAVVVTQVERWANGGEAGYRLYDWLGSAVPAAEQQGGFVNRLRTFGFPATDARIERYTLPPGLAQESFGATIHFRGGAAHLSADDVVVLFRCDRLVGSVDVVGKPGTAELSDAMQVATSMAAGMGEVCAV